MTTNPTTDAGNIAGTPLTDAAMLQTGSLIGYCQSFVAFARDLETQLTQAREATARAERERDDTAAALQRLINAIGTFQLCGVGALRTVDDVVTAMSNVAGKLEAVNLRAELATARAERDGRETDLMIALTDLAAETAKNAELRKARDDYQEMAKQSDAYILKLARLLGCTDGDDSPELGIKELLADRAALRAELLLQKETLDWIEQNWSACAFIAEGEFVNLRDDIRSRKLAALRGNDKAEKGAGELCTHDETDHTK